MCDPRLDIAFSEDGEVGPDEVVEGVAALLIGDGPPIEVAEIVVPELIVAAGFLEVFR